MGQRTYTSGKQRISQRPGNGNHAANKSNPLRPAAGPQTARADHRRSTSDHRPRAQREALLALRARLRADVAGASDAALAGSVEATSASPDVADLASEVVEQDLAVSLLGTANGTLDQIDAALQRIEDGSYGRCSRCGTKIPAARLQAIPYAICCVDCAARQERRPRR